MTTRSERAVVFLVGAVQFINILDFMMVMPLGPYFVEALGIPASSMGIVAGAYTGSAAIAGLVGSTFLDRFDRRPALGIAMLGLVLGTAAGGFATGLSMMLAARVVAGMFGGPATSLAMSIIADVVPPERRGKALGAVMGAFSVSSIAGVPAGLWLARHGGWRTPFFAVSALGLVVCAAAIFLLPSLKLHLASRDEHPPYADMLRRPTVLLSYAMTAVTMTSVFIVVPNISPFLVFNVGYPYDRLELLYMAGGLVSIVVLRIAGGLVDRIGSVPVATFGTAGFVAVMVLGFVFSLPAIPIVLMFVGFMMSTSFRNVAYNQIATRVPSSAERARFMSLQSAVQHLASALAGVAASHILTTEPSGKLLGMPSLAWISITLGVLCPAIMLLIDRRLRSAPDPAR